jgi:exosortase E/protease (VPEID-CTERM system)
MSPPTLLATAWPKQWNGIWAICRANRKRKGEKPHNNRQRQHHRLNPPPSTDNETVSSHLGLPARAAILGGLFFIEKILLTQFVDVARADAALGVSGYLRVAQNFGFRFIVTLAAAMTVFAFADAKRWKSLTNLAPPRAYLRPVWVIAHFALVACLAWLGSLLFPQSPSSIPFGAVVGLWLTCGAAACFCAFAAMAPLPLWLKAARTLGNTWIYSVAAALTAAIAIPFSEEYWWSTTAATFQLVRLLLLPILPQLTVDPATHVLGTQRFAVEILPYCSGLEGMSLILVFTLAWLWYFRNEYRFPRALALIPLGVTFMFALNAVRIAVLVLIGNAGYPDVAIYGFHSQAGWIAFNVVAVGIAFWTRRSRWLNRNEEPLQGGPSDNPTAVFLMPLLAILAAGMLSHALSGRFEWFYPLRLLACLAVIAIYRRRLAALEWRGSWRGALLGVGVFVLWSVAVHFLLPDVGMPAPLAAASPSLRWSWIVCRVAGTVLTVPVAEELAYRGFLMRRLQSRDFESLAYGRVSWFALAATSLIFGVAHGALWLPATVAGFAYGWIVIRRGQLAEAVTAHMTTNALVAAFALASGNWAGF